MACTTPVSSQIRRLVLEADADESYHRRIIMNNWLVNTTGHANSFLPLDLLQEHQNFWIKVSTLLAGVLSRIVKQYYIMFLTCSLENIRCSRCKCVVGMARNDLPVHQYPSPACFAVP